MDSQRVKSKTIKTIVPIKGNLLEKIKNKLKHNGSSTTNVQSNEVVNNGSQNVVVDPVDIKPSKGKVIIQKVEKVNLQFSEIFNEKTFSSEACGMLEEEKATVEVKEEVKASQESTQISSLKLLSAKIPENNFNREVPLKMVRTIRKPKAVPTLVKRFGNVAIHQESKKQLQQQNEQQPLPPSNQVQFTIKVLDEDDETIGNINNNNIVECNNKLIKKPISSDEEELQGFNSDASYANGDQDMKLWFQCLSSQDNIQNSSKTIASDLYDKINIINNDALNEINNLSWLSDTPCTSPSSSSVQQNELSELESNCTTTLKPIFSEDKNEDIASRLRTQIPLVKNDKYEATEKVTQKRETMDTSESKWLNDISIMIGEARIRQIDQSLKKIPVIVTGNQIQTENVELKLIINHLLEKLNVKSVAETLNPMPTEFLKDYQDSTNFGFSSSSDFCYDDSTDFDDDYKSVDKSISGSNDAQEGSKVDMSDTKLQQENHQQQLNNESENENEFHKRSSRAVTTTSKFKRIKSTVDNSNSSRESSVCSERKLSLRNHSRNSSVEPQATQSEIMQDQVANDSRVNNLSIKSFKIRASRSELIGPSPTTTYTESEIENEFRKRSSRPVTTASKLKRIKSTVDNSNSSRESSVCSERKLSLRNHSRNSSVEPQATQSEIMQDPVASDSRVNNLSMRCSKIRASRSELIGPSPTRIYGESEIVNENRKRSSRSVTTASKLKRIKSTVNNSNSSRESSACSERKFLLRNRSRYSSAEPQAVNSVMTQDQVANDSRVNNLSNSSVLLSSKGEIKKITSKRGRPRKIKSTSPEVKTKSIVQNKGSSKVAKNTKAQRKKNENSVKKAVQSRKILSNSDSEIDTPCNASELKSLPTDNDFNSQSHSSCLEHNDYLNKSSSLDKSKINSIFCDPIFEKLEEVVKRKKEEDPTYRKPPEIQKRPYLKTSAFKGNLDSTIDDENIADSNTKQPSVLLDTPKPTKNGNIKDIIHKLINKEKEKITSNNPNFESISESPSEALTSSTLSLPSASSQKEKIKNTKTKAKSSKTLSNKSIIVIKKFEQEPLQKSNEHLVLYDKILESIRISKPPMKNGKYPNQMDEETKKKVESELKKLQYFNCGNCTYLVTKHNWKNHLIDHGGIAWIDNYESPIHISQWNESVRRLINYMKIYQLESFKCPNCNQEKRSALGHLAHVYVCAQDEETMESLKAKCEYCDERVMPYSMTWHRSKCKELIKSKEVVQENNDGDDENEDDEDDKSSGSSSVNGRCKKRKAVKKAEKKFKSILKNLNQNPKDQITTLSNGTIRCDLCGNILKTKELALDHIEKNHGDSIEGDDFEDASSSDASVDVNDEESSSSTEGSSCVESSDVKSADEDDNDNDDPINVSNRQGKISTAESQEVKNARKLLVSCSETFSGSKISTKINRMTKELMNENLDDNILSVLAPKYKTPSIHLSAFLLNTQLKFTSMKFNFNITSSYSDQLKSVYDGSDEWRNLELGQSVGSKHSLTLFCGGSISGLEWSQSNDENVNFLAVACNSSNKTIKMSLEKTFKSCIQIYEFKQLVNARFQSYDANTSNMLYMFSISEGPIWSIKWHPFAVPSNERIGLLAVTTANQNLHVYSLPYLKNDDKKLLIISLEPSIVCSLAKTLSLYQEKFLLQASTVNWFYRKDKIQLLAGGYINGLVSIWKIDDNALNANKTTKLLPYVVLQPHREAVSAIDFKSTIDSEIYLLTTSFDRDIKVFALDNGQVQEIIAHYSSSRNLCAEWLLHWPGFMIGSDSCFSIGSFSYRQPIEFGMRNLSLVQCSTSVTDLSINHFQNFIICATDAGDIIGSNPLQLMSANPKDRWSSFRNTISTYTDVIKIGSSENSDSDEYGILFNDFKDNLSKRPKSFRMPATNNLLQINKVCFNRNEMSHRFYAIGYETGFVRVRHLKNFK